MKKLFWIILLCLPVQAYANSTVGVLDENENGNEITCTTGIAGFKVWGTWDGGTVTPYERIPSDGSYEEIRVAGVVKTWTADDDDNIDKSGPTRYRLTMSGAGASTDVNYYINCANTR